MVDQEKECNDVILQMEKRHQRFSSSAVQRFNGPIAFMVLCSRTRKEESLVVSGYVPSYPTTYILIRIMVCRYRLCSSLGRGGGGIINRAIEVT